MKKEILFRKFSSAKSDKKEILFRKFNLTDADRKKILFKNFNNLPEVRNCANCPKEYNIYGSCPHAQDDRIKRGQRRGKGFDCGDGRGEKCCWNSIISAEYFKHLVKREVAKHENC